jgi:sugar lactone lactonase YvrE
MTLEIAARSPFLCNAVAIDRNGTMILGLPRWTGMEQTPSVARVGADGSLVPLPGGGWNQWRPGDDGREAFVQVNALHIFGDGSLWIVDQGTPDRKTTLPGAQKLVQMDPVDGRVLKVLRFDAEILPEGAQMNDLRVFGSRLYVTDSGLGGVIVHDVATGRTLRRLSRHPLLGHGAGLPLRGTGGRPLQDANGERPQVQSDLIEMTADGRWLYVSTPTGPWRRIPVALLNDPVVDDAAIAAAIETVYHAPTLNGSAIDTHGNLLLCDAEHRRITVLAPDGRVATLITDDRLVNPDALFITADRRLYVPAPQTERLPEHDSGHGSAKPPFLVLSMPLPREVGGIVLGDAVSPVLAAG